MALSPKLALRALIIDKHVGKGDGLAFLFQHNPRLFHAGARIQEIVDHDDWRAGESSLDRTARAVSLALLAYDEAVYGSSARQRFHHDGGK